MKFIDRKKGMTLAEDYSYAGDGRVCVHKMNMTRRGFGSPTRHEYFYGGGDSPGRSDRYGQCIRVANSDCMGYDCTPENSGAPAYKQWPVFTGVIEEEGKRGCYGIYYDTGARGKLDFGTTVSAYRGFHLTAEFETPDLEYYFILGSDPCEVSNGISQLLGTPAMPTKWSVKGYNASSMLYADTEDIPNAIKGFTEKAGEEGVEVTGMYLSSGYTAKKVEGEGYVRCVFNWCHDRVENPDALFESTKETPLICNVKPWLLECHPMYGEAEGGFVSEEDGEGKKSKKPIVESMWSGGPNTSLPGSFVDFLSDKGYDFWVNHSYESLVAKGCDAIWVDNNEFEVDDSSARCGNVGEEGQRVGWCRPALTTRMAQASLEALMKSDSKKRKMVVTRGGGPGIQRYAGLTWTGDNYSNWSTLKWGTTMANSLGVSGFPGVGVDIGGFAGPAPGRELFVRWCQSSCLQARFTIHSWNEDGSITECWTYGRETTEVIKGCLALRKRFSDQLYTLFAGACTRLVEGNLLGAVKEAIGGEGCPVTRNVGYEYREGGRDGEDREDGEDVEDEHGKDGASCDYLLGRNVLVCPIYLEGWENRMCYLPKGVEGEESRWWCAKDNNFYWGDDFVEQECSCDDGEVIHFIKEGTGVAVKSGEDTGAFAEFMMIGGKGIAVGYYDEDTAGREEGLWVVVRVGGDQGHEIEWYDWKGREVGDEMVEGKGVKVSIVENIEGGGDWKTKVSVINFKGWGLVTSVRKGDAVILEGTKEAFEKYEGMQGTVMCDPGVNEKGEERTLVELAGMEEKIVNVKVEMLMKML